VWFQLLEVQARQLFRDASRFVAKPGSFIQEFNG